MPVQANPLAVAKLAARTLAGSPLNTAEWAQVPLDIRDRAFFSAELEKMRVLQRMHDRLDQAMGLLRRPGEGVDGGDGAFQTREKFIAELQALGREEGLDPRNFAGQEARLGTARDITSERRLGLIYDTQTEMAQEYARWKAEQDPDVLDACPAQEFTRVESRKVPRIDWPERWRDAGGEVFDGRMIALKNDPVWRKLSRFGTPYPPFDFGSGMGLVDVNREEAEQLGLLKKGEQVEPAERGFNEDLRASVKDLSPEYRELLLETFEGQLAEDGDTLVWKSGAVRQAQPLDPEQPRPEIEPGAGLATEPDRVTPEEAEALLLSHERATIYDREGNFLFAVDAEPSSPGAVTVDPKDWPRIKDTVFSHQHVSAGGPSLEDFAFAHTHDPAEMRIPAPDLLGGADLHRLQRPEGGWRWTREEAEERYREAGREICADLQEQVAAGRLSAREANASLEHRIMEWLVARHPEEVQYQRIAQ